MTDRQSSGLIILALAVAGGVYKLRKGRGVATGGAIEERANMVRGKWHNKLEGLPGSPLRALTEWANRVGALVTSSRGGTHNSGSAHYSGRAIDIRSKGVADSVLQGWMEDAQRAGFVVRDERVRPQGQRVWGGPHIHIEVPRRLSAAPYDAEDALSEVTG